MATSGDDKKLLKDLSNSIKDLVAPDPPQGQPITQCFVMKTGSTINPADYQGTAGPLNLARLFDDIPKISASWETSGKLISDLWEILLTTGKAPINLPPKDLEKAYKEAKIKLYGSDENFKLGDKSAFYKSVDKLRQNVQQKQLDLLLLQTKIQKDLGPDASQAEFNSAYQYMSPTYVDAVNSAQQELLIRERAIDQYTTVLFAYNTGSLETVLNNFATKMATSKRGSGVNEYYEVTANPSDWWTYFKEGYKPDNGWTEVIVNQSYSSTTGRDTYKHIGGGVDYVFFSFRTEGGKTVKTTSKEEKGLSISFKIKTVDIGRQWMDTALLDYKDLTLANTQAGQWSTGVLEPANQGSFTLLPTSMVLATDITVSASAFSSHTKDVFEQYSASTGAFWDLFCFSGGGSHSSHTSAATWNKEEHTMKVSGVQIIGYSCALIPYFPKMESK